MQQNLGLDSSLKDLLALSELAQMKKWNELLQALPSSTSDGIKLNLGSLLQAEGVPHDVLKAMLTALPSNSGGGCFDDSPRVSLLHTALDLNREPWIIREIIRVDPRSVSLVNEERESPLDIVCRKIMAEEELSKKSMSYQLQRYSFTDTAQKERLDRLWESARLILNGVGRNDPILHALANSSVDYCPEVLRQRVFRCFGDQAFEANFQGNLPLHCAATIVPEDPEEDILLDLLRVCPEASKIVGQEGKLAIELAFQCRSWTTGIKQLFHEFPGSLWRAEILQDYKVIPLLLKGKEVGDVFAILRSNPVLLRRRQT